MSDTQDYPHNHQLHHKKLIKKLNFFKNTFYIMKSLHNTVQTFELPKFPNVEFPLHVHKQMFSHWTRDAHLFHHTECSRI